MITPLLITLALLAAAVLAHYLIHRAYRAPRIRETKTPADHGLPFSSLQIPTEHGKQLFAWYIPAADGPEQHPAVAIIHGWGGNAGQMLPFARLLHDAGYTTLLLDARNHGNSDSDGHSSMPRFAEDLEQGLNWLAKQPQVDTKRLFLLGHSLGASAALLLASRRSDLAGVLSISAFAHPGELMRQQMASYRIPHRPVGWLLLRYIEWTIGARFDEIASRNTIRRVTCPVLLVHGEKDQSVPATDAEQIFAHRPHDRVELLMLPNTGHNSRHAIRRHGQSLVDFLQRQG